MHVFVYGTLKSGYGNNRLLQTSKFVKEHVVQGFKLYHSGFPVAAESEGDAVRGEVWDIGDDQEVLRRLDGLESEGHMYLRKEVEPDLYMYVGNPPFWNNFEKMVEVSQNTEGHYQWDRESKFY